MHMLAEWMCRECLKRYEDLVLAGPGCWLQAQAEVLGKLSGESVKMLVHHSRNSEQKQVGRLLDRCF
jgi:hypothetical protein